MAHERHPFTHQKSFYHEEAEGWGSVIEGDGMQPPGDFTDYGKITPRQERDVFFSVEEVDSAFAEYVNFVSMIK